MQKLFLALALFCGVSHAGVIASITVTASGGSPIPATYSYSNTQSKVMTAIPYTPQKQTELCVFDFSSKDVDVFVDNGNSTTAPSTGSQELYVPAGLVRCTTLSVSGTVYLRSDSTAITAGSVKLELTN